MTTAFFQKARKITNNLKQIIMGGILTFLGGAAGTAGSVIGQSIANESNERLNALNRQHERELLYMQQDFAQQQAEKADERTRALYTDLQSPEALRKQLEAAGLSVGMMYGQGGAGGSMQAGAQAESPAAQNRGTIPMQNIMDAQTMMMLANAEKAKAETQNIEEDTKKKEAETQSTWRDIPVKEKQLIVMDSSINKMKSEINKNAQEINKMEAEINNLMAETELKNNQSELTKVQKEVQEAVKEWQTKQNELADIQIKWQDKLYGAEYENLKSKAKEARASADNLITLTKKTSWEAKILAETAEYQIKKVLTEFAVQKAEAMTWSDTKKLQLDKLRAEIESMDWKTATEKQKTEFFNQYDNLFGEGYGGMMRTIVEDLWPHFGAGQVNK